MAGITKTSRIARTSQEKISSLIARLSLVICRRENAALYQRYTNIRAKYLKMKIDIIRKYSPKATMAAREIVKKARSGR